MLVLRLPSSISARFVMCLAWVLLTVQTWASPADSTQTPTADSMAMAAKATQHDSTKQAHTDQAHGEQFNVNELLFHHILDSHDWHITDIPTGDGHYAPIALHLPWIVYNSEKGFEFFFISGHNLAEKQASAAALGYTIDEHEHLHPASGHATIIDLSITKTVLQMMLVGLLLIWLFTSIARSYVRSKGQAPRGKQGLFEPIILFVRDQIAKPNLHGKHDKYVPYLLSLFFFIWFSNLLGLTPFNSNIAGNISVTVGLAILTFIIVQFSGTKDYWQHIFWYPGVPLPVKFIMLPVELIGMFTKPFSLTVRLFANITAGHFMVLSLIALIFILNASNGLTGALSIMPLSLAFTLAIMLIEVLVAIIQAYVFTLLTAVFIGQALETHHHDDHAHDAAHH